MKLTIAELTRLEYALRDVTGYLTDNSCSDPDCCGGPFYYEKDYEEGIKLLAKYNIEVDVT